VFGVIDAPFGLLDKFLAFSEVDVAVKDIGEIIAGGGFAPLSFKRLGFKRLGFFVDV
jgi:hypothetical protein